MSDTGARDEPIPPQRDESRPASPLALSWADWKVILKNTLKEVQDDRVTFAGGSLAYYWFLAVFPSIIATVGLVNFLRLPRGLIAQLVDILEHLLPSGAARVLVTAIQEAGATGKGSLIAAVVAIAVALWSGSSGTAALMTALNIAYEVSEDRNFVARRLMALALMLVMFLFGGAATALLVFGKPIGGFIADTMPLAAEQFVFVWDIVRWALTVLIVLLLFAVFYFLAPNRESPRWQWVSAGSVLATAIWLAVSFAFSFYIGTFGNSHFADTYSGIVGPVLLILWLYFTSLAMLLGAELNAEIERRRSARRRL